MMGEPVTPSRRGHRRPLQLLRAMLLSALLTQSGAAQQTAPTPQRPMTVADLFTFQGIDAAAVDAGSTFIAVVVQRARRAGEPTAGESLYGGNVRGDVLVLDAAHGREIFRTSGEREHAGYWRPVWSPSGQRLAMLRLRNDTMSVCLWQRGAEHLTCLPEDASVDFMTQISIGSNADGSHRNDTPFVWFSDSTLAIAVLPQGELDHAAGRSHQGADSVSAAWARERQGQQPSVTVLDTPLPTAARSDSVELRIANVARGTTRVAARIPHLYWSARRIVISPRGTWAAILADEGLNQPAPQGPFGFYNQARTALGVIDLRGRTPAWWAPSRPYTRFARWASDERRFGVLAKRSDDENVVQGSRLFVVDPVRRTIDSATVDPAADRSLRWVAEDRASGVRATATTPAGQILATAPNGAYSIARHRSAEGTTVWQVFANGDAPRVLLRINPHAANIADATRMLIAYRARDGSEQRGVVLLPPGFEPGARYPLIAWLYPGMEYVDTLNGQWLRSKDDPFPLNPHVLAGRGYAVLFPSMPMPPEGVGGEPYDHVLDGVDAAIDTLIARGIADSTRLGLIGQSYGGYAVNCIVSQSHRFRAAASLAGIADLTSSVLIPTPASRHTPSPVFWLPWAEVGQGRMGGPPWRDIGRYARNSPIMYADQVNVPILFTGGDNDYVEQGEEWFTALHRAGKRARFLAYWGGQHMPYSPANIAHLWGEILGWFDTYLVQPRKALTEREGS